MAPARIGFRSPMTRLLITAGPTHEPIDAVRYIANRSSGRLGISLAEAAAERGHDVTLLLGPVPREPSASGGGGRITTTRFTTTADLQALLRELWPRHDVLVMAAAVSDYRPVDASSGGKVPRGGGTWRLDLEPTPDLLAEAAAAARPGQVAIGFALEPDERLLDSARAKLAAKNLAAIVANPLETMDSDRIEATVLLRDGRLLRPAPGRIDKADFAAWLLDQLDTIAGAVAVRAAPTPRISR